MLKVLIADDERIQREGICKNVIWQELGMQVAALASDGVEALELMNLHKPDILITDIKMPYMSGLELARRAREILPGIKIIIVSGYDDFELAREAIEISACTYLLKPVEMSEIREKLGQIRNICVSEQAFAKEYLALKEQLEQSKPLLRDKFLQELLYGRLENNDEIRKRMDFFGLYPPTEGFYVMVLQLDGLSERAISEEEKHITRINLLNCLIEVSQNSIYGIPVHLKEDEFVLIFFSDSLKASRIEEDVACIRQKADSKLNIPVTIGISGLKYELCELNNGYREAELAVRQKFFLGKGQDIFYTGLHFKNVEPAGLDEEYDELLSGIRIGDAEKAGRHMNMIFGIISGTRSVNEQYIKAFCFQLMSDVYRILYSMDEKVQNIFGEEDALWDKVYRFDTIPDVRQWLKNIIHVVSQYIFAKRIGNNSQIVETIRGILEEKYNEQISVESLARKVHLTPNYLSSIFKGCTGESIIDYLTKLRMKHARRLLEESVLKVYEISERVGFNNTTYFSSVFKNTYGITPKECREHKENGGNHA